MVTMDKTGLLKGIVMGNVREYSVEIIETLSRTVIVEAENELEALAQVKHLYSNESIVLNSKDYVITEFKLAESMGNKPNCI
jgi:hypothetical protein